MTATEYSQSGYENRHSKFTFEDGTIAYGVITTFFQDEPGKFYLVRSPQMIEFKGYMENHDTTKMKEIAIPVDLADIVTVEPLDSFGQLLLKKIVEVEEKKDDWEKRKNKWIHSTDTLFENIKTWLSDFKNAGLLDIKEKEIELNEDYIGNYKSRSLEILLGNDVISLTPKGTLIIGSYGRVDMKGPKGEALIVEPSWNDWKFAVRVPRTKYWDLNEQSFKEAIQELVNG